MQTVHFLGRVIPEIWKINIGDTPVATFSEIALDFKASICVRIAESMVDVECQMDPYRQDQYVLLYIRAYDQARAAIDLVSFASGIGQFLVFDSFIDREGKSWPVRLVDPNFGNLSTAFRVNTPPSDHSFHEVYTLVVTDYEFFMALRDLMDAFAIPHSTSINCGRVLDGIKRMISPGVTEPRRAWAGMQAALNISRSYQQWITDMSANPRHADRSYIAGADTTEILKRTWIIMNRFMEYRKRGNIPLLAPDFPTLSP
jgi:hypothetical protein